MKRYIVLFSVLSIMLAAFVVLGGCAESAEPIRIHIRANSDGDVDQAVKYIVRDAVVEYLSEAMSTAGDRDEAYRRLSARLSGIKKTAESTLADCGLDYGADAYLSHEWFPDRDYGGAVYPAGEYDALIVELGTGTGGNWWCVAYPPLCFYGDDGEEFRYRSLIAELLGLS